MKRITHILKYNWIILLTAMLFTGNLFGQKNVDSLFVEANKLYQKERFNEALPLYKQIENQGLVSGSLYFNMANVYYRTNQVANAIYYYEKAIKLKPGNKDYKFNLAFAQRMTLDNIDVLPKTIGDRFREGVILKWSQNTWAVIAVILSCLFAVLFLLFHFSEATGRKRLFFITSMVAIGLSGLTVFFAVRHHQIKQNTTYAIVFYSEADVKSAPSQSGEINFELHEGTKVQVLERLEHWKKIKIANGKTGWIKADAIKEI